ncbi:MAG: LCP family protein [Candidatus Eremiobacteraeota bacterium]|nr:LCP family protein [Candidatus Eremiobacteraeota bacterium]
MGKHLDPEYVAQPRRSPLRLLFFAALLVAFGLAIFIGAYSMITHRSIKDLVMSPLAPPPQEVFGKNNILVLLEGLDYDYNSKDEEYSSQARSDVIKALNLDFVNKRVFEVDVPRDMDAVLPNGREAKINEAQSEGGTKEAQAVISKFLGVPGFDRYIVFRVNTAKDFINAIGGVDVLVQNSDPKDTRSTMDYDDTWGHLHIHLKPGFQHLNGDQAVGYMRFRHDWCGDLCRISRQQQVMRVAMTKLRDNKANTLAHLPQLLDAFHRDVYTNLTNAEMLSIAFAFSDMPKDGYKPEKLTYVDTKVLADGGEVIIPDAAQKERVVQNYLIAPPVPTASPNPAAIAAIDPHRVHVDVLNGTGVPGAGRRIADKLRAKGFAIGTVGNAPTSDVQVTEVHEHSSLAGSGVRVRDALGTPGQKATILTDTASPASTVTAPASDVTVVVGLDLAAALKAASITP